MIVYTDKLSGDEIMSDAYTLKDSTTPGLWEIDGRLLEIGSDGHEITGGNPSAEEDGDDDGGENTVSTRVINIVNQFRLGGILPKPSKRSATAEIQKYCKALAKHIEQNDGNDAMNAFLKIAPNAARKLLENWDDHDVFVGESMSPEGMWIIVDYRDDGITPFAMIWKDGVDAKQV